MKSIFDNIVTFLRALFKRLYLVGNTVSYYNVFKIFKSKILDNDILELLNFYKDKRVVGASTITQQVAKNFLLSADYSIERKNYINFYHQCFFFDKL